MIFRLFLITQPKSDIFTYKYARPTFVLVWHLYWSDICTGLTFVLVWRLYWSDVSSGLTFVLIWRLYWSDVCTGLMFVLAQSLSQSHVCPSLPQFVPVRRFKVQCLYCLNFVTSEVCGSDICISTRLSWFKIYLLWYIL